MESNRHAISGCLLKIMKVSVYGVDGAGKTTLLSALESKLLKDGFTVVRNHWRPYNIKPRTITQTDRPHQIQGAGKLKSIVKISAYFFDFFMAGMHRKFSKTEARTIVFHERDFYDCIFDPRRYGLSAGQSFARFLGRFLPEPECVVLLYGDADIIQKRKNEVELGELTKSIDRLLAAKNYFKNPVLLKTTSLSLEECVDSLDQAIRSRISS